MNRSSAMIFKFNQVFLCIVNIIFTFVGIFLNSVVIMSLLNSQLRRKICYFMILVLACSDLVVVVVFHPFITVRTLLCCNESVKEHNWLYHLFEFSFMALLTMTVERYLALVFPFSHQKYVTRSRLMVAFVIFQLPFGISIFVEKYANEYVGQALLLALIGAAFLLICGMNFKLFYLAKTLRQRLDIPLGSLEGFQQIYSASSKSKGTLASLRKISTCLLAVLCLFICQCPSIALIGLKLTNSQNEGESGYMYIIDLWAQTVLTLNSSLNCLIFFYKNRVLRHHAMNQIGKCLSSMKAALHC